MTKAVWSFCRFLHFVTTAEGLNSLSERSVVVDAESPYQMTIVPRSSWLKLDPRRFGSYTDAFDASVFGIAKHLQSAIAYGILASGPLVLLTGLITSTPFCSKITKGS